MVYVKPTVGPMPEKPPYYEMKWHGTNGEYCLSEEEAKKLSKNAELQKDYIRQLESELMRNR